MPDVLTAEHLDHIKKMLAAQEEYATHRDWLISDELREQLPEFVSREASAAAVVRKLWDILQEPEKLLARINADIDHAEAESQQWQRNLADAGDMGERVTARSWFAEWSERVDELTGQRDLLERELEPIRKDYEEAKQEAQDAAEKRAAFELNLIIPLFDLGQDTKAFRAWYLETGAFVPILLAMDRRHHLWEKAFSFLDVICQRSGYRTDHLSTDAEQVRRSIENYTAAKLNARNASSAPSGAEVMAMDALRIAEMQAPKQRVEDLRGVRTPGSYFPAR